MNHPDASALHAQEHIADVISRRRRFLTVLIGDAVVMDQRRIFRHGDRLRVGQAQSERSAVVKDDAEVDRFRLARFTGAFFLTEGGV